MTALVIDASVAIKWFLALRRTLLEARVVLITDTL
jgi:hypothetical protein